MRQSLVILGVLGCIVAIFIALLIPVHLRATDPLVLEQIGRHDKSLVEFTRELVRHNPSAGKILLQASEQLNLEGTDNVVDALREGYGRARLSRTLLQELEADAAGRVQVQESSVVAALRKKSSRDRLRETLKSSEARQVLGNLTLTNTTVFAPAGTAAGLPLEIAVLTTAWLVQGESFGAATTREKQFNREVVQLATAAGAPENISHLEEFYLNIFALAKRFSSEQMLALVVNLESFEALDRIARWFQHDEENVATLYAAAIVAGKGGSTVSDYLRAYPESGMDDIRYGLWTGVAGLRRLLDAGLPLYRADTHNALLANGAFAGFVRPMVRFSANSRALALQFKFVLMLCSGLLLAWGVSRWKTEVAEQGYVWFSKFRMLRRAAFATVFLLLAILIGEPYLAQGDQNDATKPLLDFSFLATISAENVQPPTSTTMLDQYTILALLMFLVIQGVIYILSLVKVAEIRKQPLSSDMKLKLLDNEENLFDAGLYCGLLGTVASLVFLALGILKPSLVAAYSSTMFGILFVAILKIGHIRPYKRRLILDADKPHA